MPGNTAFFNFVLAQAQNPNDRNAGIDAKYYAQMQLQMACAGPERTSCFFVMFNPRLPEANQLAVTRVLRDDAFISEMESEIMKFLAELNDRVSKLQSIFGVKNV